jgi:hypothetical protein
VDLVTAEASTLSADLDLATGWEVVIDAEPVGFQKSGTVADQR